MSIFDLEKRQQAIKFVLEKRAIRQAPVMRVGAALDVSGSSQHLYKRGVMQATIDRLVPVAMRFDDNGEMDVWSFDTNHNQLASVTKLDYEGYVQREIMSNGSISKWGGTQYGGVMNDMANFYFGAPKAAPRAGGFLGGLFGRKEAAAPVASTAPSNVPAMALLITDGANQDRSQAAAILRNAQNKPIYWQLIGVGDPSEFGFLKEMADELPNVGFVHLTSLEISDEDLYDRLLSEELCQWIAKR